MAVVLSAAFGLLVVASSAAAQGVVGGGPVALYVSPRGNDHNPGTRMFPFRTLQHARDVVRGFAGDLHHDITVYLFGGTYSLRDPLILTSQDSGTNGHEVVYQAVRGQTPIVSGGARLTGWTLHDAAKNIWQAHVPAGLDTRQLYVNGVRATRAQGQPPVMLTPSPGGYTASSPLMSTWSDASQLEFVYRGGAGAWTEPRCGVASIAGTQITMQEPCWDNTTNRNPQTGPSMSPSTLPTYIDNAYELLDQPGEWYLDRRSATIYYIPRPGENLATATVVAPALQTLVEGDGTLAHPVHDIAFRGITFAYATWLEPDSGNGFSDYQADTYFSGNDAGQTQGACSYGGTCPYGAATIPHANVSFEAAHHVLFTDDVFAHLGGSGLGFDYGSQGNAVTGNVFTDVSANGVQIGNTDDAEPSDVGADAREINADNRVSDNYIHDTSVEYQGGVGIWEGYTQNSDITHNQIDDVPYTAISSGWGWAYDPSTDTTVARGNRIDENLIFDHMQTLVDGGGIYVNGVQGTSAQTGTQIIGNVVHDQLNPYNALYTDASEDVTMERNVLYNNPNDWGGCRDSDLFGNFVFEDNWWQGKGPNFGCGPVVQPETIADNMLISGPQDVPEQVLDNAGLQPPYKYLLNQAIPRKRLLITR